MRKYKTEPIPKFEPPLLPEHKWETVEVDNRTLEQMVVGGTPQNIFRDSNRTGIEGEPFGLMGYKEIK